LILKPSPERERGIQPIFSHLRQRRGQASRTCGYNEILESLREEYAPQSTQEEMLVNQITENYWRLIRARNMESGSFKMGIKLEAQEYGIKILLQLFD